MTSGADPAVARLPPSPPRAPASDRLCDTVVAAFALWTLSSHAIVAARGGLVALLVLYAVVLAAAVWASLRWRAVAAPWPNPTGFAELSRSPRWRLWILRGAVLAAGAAVALSFAARPDVRRLWWSAVILLGFAAVAVYFKDEPPISVEPPIAKDEPLISPSGDGRSSEARLWLLAAAAVILTLVSHRPDADDAFYVNVAVAAADVPGRALLSGDTLHGIPGFPLYLPVYRVHSYELLNAALAYLTGIPAIYAFHWVSAAFAALLVPLAHARLFRILTPRRWLATVATLMFILVAAGETHRWYGNFSFVRMWQGKALFLFIFIPLVYAYALRFASRPNLRDWALLAAAQIAAVGCSSSALWVAPASAALALCAGAKPSGQGLKTVVLGASGSLYVLGAAWLTKTNLVGPFFMGASVAPGADPGPMLRAALVTVLGDSRLLTFGIVTLLTAWVFAPTGLARRFAVVFPLGLLLGLLNPYLATWVPANVTGPSYWRSMWALPLPILMAMLLTSPLDPGGGRSRPWTGRAAWLVLLAAFALLVPRFSGISPQNGVTLGWPRLKVPDRAYRWAAAINESVPPGSHVAAPAEVGPWITTFHHHRYPLAVRHYLFPWGDLVSREEAQARWAMQRFLGAPELVEATPQQFRATLDRFDVRAVCLVNSPRAEAAKAILQQAGFRRTLREEDYELWVRPGSGPNARREREDR